MEICPILNSSVTVSGARGGRGNFPSFEQLDTHALVTWCHLTIDWTSNTGCTGPEFVLNALLLVAYSDVIGPSSGQR